MSDLLYIARAIDRAEPSEFTDSVLDAIGRHQMNAGFGAYRPELAFNVGNLKPEPYVRRINNTALLFSDAVLAIWPHDAKSWGVPAEVERAVMLDKPVLILTNGKPTWSMIDEKIEIAGPNTGDIDETVRWAMQWLRLKVDEKKAGNR